MRPLELTSNEVEMENGALIEHPPDIKQQRMQCPALTIAVGLVLSVVVAACGVALYNHQTLKTIPAKTESNSVVMLAKQASPLSLGLGTACRKGTHHDQTIVPKHVKIIKSSRSGCLSKCTSMGSACHACEFRESEQRCELWEEPSRGHASLIFEDMAVKGVPDFECFIMSGRCETLKAHKQQLEESMSTLLGHIKDHCMEGPSYDKYDKCSKAYAESLLEANMRFCTAIQQNCPDSSGMQCD
ncbi:unnamed protein product [Symbiodinium necroappetens]|uniref:Apple domain-containing protein n=1 Tax=Symbiodinium necroappetens TaxID=1628268 RepID=A0A812N6E4_9DINO|nr:unnamed protein product [Symbiodinium necroappetens]